MAKDKRNERSEDLQSPDSLDFDSLIMEKSFSIWRVEGGWQFREAWLDKETGKVLKIVKAEPDVKAMAREQFKIGVGKHWMKNQA